MQKFLRIRIRVVEVLYWFFMAQCFTTNHRLIKKKLDGVPDFEFYIFGKPRSWGFSNTLSDAYFVFPLK